MTYLRYLSLVVRRIGFYPVIVEDLFLIILSKPYKRNLRLSCHSIIQDSLPFRNHFLSKKLQQNSPPFPGNFRNPSPGGFGFGVSLPSSEAAISACEKGGQWLLALQLLQDAQAVRLVVTRAINQPNHSRRTFKGSIKVGTVLDDLRLS